MNTTQLVEEMLSMSQQARNSDKHLWLMIAQRSGVNLTEAQIDKIRQMPSFETIRRVRQKTQEGGKYPAETKVKKERDFKAMRMQQNAPSAKPKTIEKIIEQPVQSAMPWMDD